VAFASNTILAFASNTILIGDWSDGILVDGEAEGGISEAGDEGNRPIPFCGLH
jgi:hypothetical protein